MAATGEVMEMDWGGSSRDTYAARVMRVLVRTALAAIEKEWRSNEKKGRGIGVARYAKRIPLASRWACWGISWHAVTATLCGC
jgi:hypothetical protein